MFRTSEKNNLYRKIVNTNFEHQDILSSYMNILNQIKTCSYTTMCNDIDLYHRNYELDYKNEKYF